ncbi:unnamed protein product [Prunus brigantina]
MRFQNGFEIHDLSIHFQMNLIILAHVFTKSSEEASYETRHHMERCIKALCNTDITSGLKIGRDVSLPETYVRSAINPLRDLGGKPPSQREILAFYAGNVHG